jgi:hypothetical protein
MNVRFFVNYGCTTFNNDNKGIEPNFRGDGFWVYDVPPMTAYIGSKEKISKITSSPIHRAEF